MHLFSILWRESPVKIVLAVIAGLVGGSSAAGLLILINASLNADRVDLTSLIWRFAAVACAMLIANIVSQLLLTFLAQGMIFELRLRLSRYILAAPLRRLEEIGGHRLLATLTDDVNVISDAVLCIPLICISIATVIVCMAYLAWVSWAVLLIVLAFLLGGSLVFQLMASYSEHQLKLAREEEDSLFSHFRGMTEGTKELKLHGSRRQAFLSDVLQPTAVTFRHHSVLGMSMYNMANGVGETLFFVCIGLLLFAWFPANNVPPQSIIGIAMVVLYLKTPLDLILSLLPRLGRASVALAKVRSLGLSLAQESSEHEFVSSSKTDLPARIVEAKGITHKYYQEQEDHYFMLGPINLTLCPGEIVFLVGGNGSGKTTFAKLLTGLYKPEDGELRLNEQVITEENRDWYRQHFTAVFSDFYLFDQLLGLDTGKIDAQTHAYLEQLELAHKVQIVNGALSTTALSQGQRKRLALLTAYLEDRPVYVFDEWASDQDPVFKEIFYTQLLPMLKNKGKIVLVITHDDKYFHTADRLIKLDYGKLTETLAPSSSAGQDTFAKAWQS